MLEAGVSIRDLRGKQVEKGIVLLSAFFLTLVVLMFIGAAVLVGPRTLGLAGAEDREFQAAQAAQSGIEYALSRLRENPLWRGEGVGSVFSSPGFTVLENQGYVWGHLTAAGGTNSMFRIRFNYEDGADGVDNLDDSTGARISTSFVSVNNLINSESVPVPRASSTLSNQVLDPELGTYSVPAHGVCLLVEGLSGPGVQSFDPRKPELSGRTTSKVIESTYIVANLTELPLNAAVMSNSDVRTSVSAGNQVLVETRDGSSANLRSRGILRVNAYGEGLGQGEYATDGSVFSGDGLLDALPDGDFQLILRTSQARFMNYLSILLRQLTERARPYRVGLTCGGTTEAFIITTKTMGIIPDGLESKTLTRVPASMWMTQGSLYLLMGKC